VNIQALPKKLIQVIKKVYEQLNSNTHLSNSSFTKRKFLNVTIATVAIILVSGFMLTQVMSAIQLSSTISNTGTLRLSAGMGVYWDTGFTNEAVAFNWQSMEPGATKTYSVYIRNEGVTALTLSMSTSNWNPSSASNYLTLTWNYANGQTLNSGDAVKVTLTLAVSPRVTGVSNFNFDVTAEGRL
jgi:hypothetical protein